MLNWTLEFASGSEKTSLRLDDGPATGTVYFANVSYALGIAETALADLAFDPIGLGTLVGDFDLPFGSFFDVFTDLDLASGAFARFQAEMFADALHTSLIGRGSYELSRRIPLPSSIWLVCIGLACLGWRLQRRRDSPALPRPI